MGKGRFLRALAACWPCWQQRENRPPAPAARLEWPLVALFAAHFLLWPDAAPVWAQPASPATGNATQSGTAPAAQPAPPRRPPLPAELLPLLSAEPSAWLGMVDQLRAAPDRARELLLAGLAAQPASPRRWRLAYYLGSFGKPQDLVTLVAAMPTQSAAPDRQIAWERQTILGALQTLYPVPTQPADLMRMFNEFLFQAQGPPAPLSQLAPPRPVGPPLSAGLFPALIAQGEPPEPPSTRVGVEGTFLLGLSNTEPRPVLVSLVFTPWQGRFEAPPETEYVFLQPGESTRLELHARLIGPDPPGSVRVDLRAREINAPQNVLSRKVFVPLKR